MKISSQKFLGFAVEGASKDFSVGEPVVHRAIPLPSGGFVLIRGVSHFQRDLEIKKAQVLSKLTVEEQGLLGL